MAGVQYTPFPGGGGGQGGPGGNAVTGLAESFNAGLKIPMELMKTLDSIQHFAGRKERRERIDTIMSNWNGSAAQYRELLSLDQPFAEALLNLDTSLSEMGINERKQTLHEYKQATDVVGQWANAMAHMKPDPSQQAAGITVEDLRMQFLDDQLTTMMQSDDPALQQLARTTGSYFLTGINDNAISALFESAITMDQHIELKLKEMGEAGQTTREGMKQAGMTEREELKATNNRLVEIIRNAGKRDVAEIKEEGETERMTLRNQNRKEVQRLKNQGALDELQQYTDWIDKSNAEPEDLPAVDEQNIVTPDNLVSALSSDQVDTDTGRAAWKKITEDGGQVRNVLTGLHLIKRQYPELVQGKKHLLPLLRRGTARVVVGKDKVMVVDKASGTVLSETSK